MSTDYKFSAEWKVKVIYTLHRLTERGVERAKLK